MQPPIPENPPIPTMTPSATTSPPAEPLPIPLGQGGSLNLPNALTVVRIFLVPILVVVLLTKFEGRLILGVRKELVGAAIFALASLTDFLDGYLARRRKQVTVLGQLMDPMADKLLTMAAFISLVQMDLAPAWMVAVIIGRELAVTGLRGIAYARSTTIPASPLGKFKMASQVVALLLLILGRDHLQGFFILGQIALWVVLITAIVSALDYYRRFKDVLNPRTE
jgi:CDP-diacylglycerol--glycerol-3-phosphate 3-phosphatidyltransferase